MSCRSYDTSAPCSDAEYRDSALNNFFVKFKKLYIYYYVRRVIRALSSLSHNDYI